MENPKWTDQQVNNTNKGKSAFIRSKQFIKMYLKFIWKYFKIRFFLV